MTERIDKQAFLAAVICPTQGWYVFRAPEDQPRPALEWRFYVGNEIGRIARAGLGEAVRLPRTPVEAARAATAEALGHAANVVALEATFASDDFIARADAVRRNSGGWDLIEVKSGKLPSNRDPEEVKSDYIDDLAFTASVADACGVNIARCVLVLVRGEYRYGEPLSELLGELDVTEQVLPRAREFSGLAPAIATALRSETRPDPALILACKDCPFYETDCLGVGVSDPLFALPRLSSKRFEQFKAYGRISALPTDAQLTDAQRRVADVIQSGRPLVEPEGLKHLDNVLWPASYLDFESVNPAIPWFPEAGPYEQIPFQFSIHRCEGPGQVVAHHEYLAPSEGDWREELALYLAEHLADRGSTLMYSNYERRMLNYLAGAVPALAPRLGALQERLFDLEPVFKNGYCHPGFRGRTSIKETLPTMVTDLSYKNLSVRRGDDAAGLFGLMRVGKYSATECAQHRDSLLEYCKLDTLAMVRLHQKLLEIRALQR